MNVENFADILGADFYAGIPDSLLKPFCDYIYGKYGTDPKHHIIAANEGNCAALAAGYYLVTGKIPAVYMQNSGEGNIINPVASLLNDKVYGIPILFVIGWRGEPNVHDEPQHIYQGEVTLKLLEDMDIAYFVLDKDTSESELEAVVKNYAELFAKGKSAAIVVRKGALSNDNKVKYSNGFSMKREEIIQRIADVSGEDPVISTTGKASRELFEYREKQGAGHQYDFLTVGSMGHSSSIALGIAVNTPEKKIWCVDGDGAALMHMGAMAVIGSVKPKNLVHIVINNGSHETVGGMPTVMGSVDLPGIAESCGYEKVMSAGNFEELDKTLAEAKISDKLTFIEAKCSVGAREDLGRPTVSAAENKKAFMKYLGNKF